MLRLSLFHKIGLTIAVVGIFSMVLVYYISDSYRNFAYQHHIQSIQQLTYLEVDDLIDELKADSLELALAIEHEAEFKHSFNSSDLSNLTQQLDNQFYQYFVTAGVLKLLKLYILDTDFTLISTSNEGIETSAGSELICPQLSQSALSRLGSEKLQTMSRICLYRNYPVFAVIVPFGGLNPEGYIQVITDLAHNLKKIESSLAMPVQIKQLNNQTIYQSEQWQRTVKHHQYLTVNLPIVDNTENVVMNIRLNSDMSHFNHEITQHRNWVMALALIANIFTIFIVLFILQKSTILPLAKIHDVLEKINSHHLFSDKDSRLLFEQLLGNIISLRKKSRTSFSVMLLDLNHFKKINSEYGKIIADLLLIDVENRLGSILRNSDLISWIGSDTPGEKALRSNNKTQYRATIARLGGDKFGLLLPTAHTEEQAKAVAERMIKVLNSPFTVCDQNITIKCRIVISLFPEHGENEKTLIKNAEKAMYYAQAEQQAVFVYDATLVTG